MSIAEIEYRKEPWNREKSDAYIAELENKYEDQDSILKYRQDVIEIREKRIKELIEELKRIRDQEKIDLNIIIY